jgi:anti-anti-sigma factor
VEGRRDGLVTCEGEWDISRAGELRRLAALGLAAGPPLLVLDFRPATFVDASTVGAICALSRQASQRGIQVVVTCSEGLVQRVFELTHLADVVPVGETVEDALRAASARG